MEKGGMRVVLLNGIPDSNPLEKSEWERVDAVVIALKSRSSASEKAVEDTLKAANWLKAHGAEHYYIKYCSTFDSTKNGNIGPVCDAMLEWMGEKYTILCPSLPVNGRTVKDGCLYVENVPLSESHMRYHPLNPMTDSRIKNLMEAQSRYHVCEIGRNYEIKEKADGQNQKHFYLVPDYETEEDGEAIAEAFRDIKLFTGGSGLPESLARIYTGGCKGEDSDFTTEAEGRTLILAGSCSKMTLEQIEEFQQTGQPSYRIEPSQLLEGKQSLDEFKGYIEKSDGNVLIYSSDTVTHIQNNSFRQREVSDVLEQALSELALFAIKAGIDKIIVAGGETSGAVMLRLNYKMFHIGKSVAPGVPVLIPFNRPKLHIVLKSGNFGKRDFFVETVKRM